MRRGRASARWSSSRGGGRVGGDPVLVGARGDEEAQPNKLVDVDELLSSGQMQGQVGIISEHRPVGPVLVRGTEAVAAGTGRLFRLLVKGAIERVVEEDGGDVGQTGIADVMPGDEGLNLAVVEDQRGLGETVLRAEHDAANSPVM